MYQELDKLDPRMINHKEENRKQILELLEQSKNDDYFHYAKEIAKEEWFGRRGNHHTMVWLSPILHWLNSHYPYQDWCKELHPAHDPVRCAFVYQYFKPHDDFDRIMDWDRTYFDYTDE